MSEIIVREVADAAQIRDFIELPKWLYLNHPGYVAHLDMERREALDRKKNPYFQHAQSVFFLAYRDGRPVGRITAQICDLYRAKYGEEIGHFGFFDAIDDAEVAKVLLKEAENWLRNRGIKQSLGPFHFSSNEEMGLMIEGFTNRSVVMMPYHPPYLAKLLEQQAYEKAKDVIAYDLDIQTYRPMGNKILRRAAEESRIRIRPLNRADFEKDLGNMLDIFNDAWSENWGMIPFTEEEVRAAVKALKPLISAPLVRIAEIDKNPTAMILCLPNLNEAIRDMNGKLLPFGWAKLLWRLKAKRIRSARIPLMGIRKKYHGTPAASAMLALMFDSLVIPASSWGFKNIEMSWILEDNMPMRRVIEAVGGRAYKTYRIYGKYL